MKGKEAYNLSLQILSLLSYAYNRLVVKAKEKLEINDDEKDGPESDEENAAEEDKEEDEDKASDDEKEKDPSTLESKYTRS